MVVVNTGWGENLFLKDIWPKARHVAYFEYYYAAKGQDLDFDPEFPVNNEEVIWRLRAEERHAARRPRCRRLRRGADRATSATPSRPICGTGIAIIHDGIDTQTAPAGPERARSSSARTGRASPATRPSSPT